MDGHLNEFTTMIIIDMYWLNGKRTLIDSCHLSTAGN